MYCLNHFTALVYKGGPHYGLPSNSDNRNSTTNCRRVGCNSDMRDICPSELLFRPFPEEFWISASNKQQQVKFLLFNEVEIKKRGSGLADLSVIKAAPNILWRSYHKYNKSSEDMDLPMLQRILFRADPFFWKISTKRRRYGLF